MTGKVHSPTDFAEDAAPYRRTRFERSENARDIVLACQQHVMGAYGYAEGFNMERLVRDVLVMPIAGGSTAIQRNNIANLMKLPRE